MLPDSEHVESHLVSVLDLLYQLAQTIRRTDGKTAVVVRGREAVYPDLHGCILWRRRQVAGEMIAGRRRSAAFAKPPSTPAPKTSQVIAGVQRSARPTRASSEYRPYPVRTSAMAAVAYRSGTSMPLSLAKSPCSQCTVMAATIMTEIMSAGPTGPRKPSATRIPLVISVIDAAAANARPGRNPRWVKNSPVLANPYPPNHPNSFCAPCAAITRPMMILASSNPMFNESVSAYISLAPRSWLLMNLWLLFVTCAGEGTKKAFQRASGTRE